MAFRSKISQHLITDDKKYITYQVVSQVIFLFYTIYSLGWTLCVCVNRVINTNYKKAIIFGKKI